MAFSYAELMMERVRLQQRLVVSEAENARLREALDIIFKTDDEDHGGEMWYAEALSEAISKARAVLKETDQ